MLAGIGSRCRCVLFGTYHQVSSDAVGINKFYQIKVLISSLKYLKFHSLRKHEGWYKNQVCGKCFTTEVISEETENKKSEKVKSKETKKKKSVPFIIPSLSCERIKELTSIAGIYLEGTQISWIKVAFPAMSVLEWNSQTLPNDISKLNEFSTLKLAYNLKDNLPTADLYVKELPWIMKKNFSLNTFRLSSMLMVLLNGLNPGEDGKEKVVLQNRLVMNNLYNILVSSERVSAIQKVEDFLYKCQFLKQQNRSDPKVLGIYSSLGMNINHLQAFQDSDSKKKDGLSYALLLISSFVDINILKDEKSIKEVLEKKMHKLKFNT